MAAVLVNVRAAGVAPTNSITEAYRRTKGGGVLIALDEVKTLCFVTVLE